MRMGALPEKMAYWASYPHREVIMTVNSVASSPAVAQTAPARPPEPVKAAAKPAEKVTPPPPPPPPQVASAPTVNTSGQKIGTTINTSA
jgi:type IV secretory pathway VirB10-like protein